MGSGSLPVAARRPDRMNKPAAITRPSRLSRCYCGYNRRGEPATSGRELGEVARRESRLSATVCKVCAGPLARSPSERPKCRMPGQFWGETEGSAIVAVAPRVDKIQRRGRRLMLNVNASHGSGGRPNAWRRALSCDSTRFEN